SCAANARACSASCGGQRPKFAPCAASAASNSTRFILRLLFVTVTRREPRPERASRAYQKLLHGPHRQSHRGRDLGIGGRAVGREEDRLALPRWQIEQIARYRGELAFHHHPVVD